MAAYGAGDAVEKISKLCEDVYARANEIFTNMPGDHSEMSQEHVSPKMSNVIATQGRKAKSPVCSVRSSKSRKSKRECSSRSSKTSSVSSKSDLSLTSELSGLSGRSGRSRRSDISSRSSGSDCCSVASSAKSITTSLATSATSLNLDGEMRTRVFSVIGNPRQLMITHEMNFRDPISDKAAEFFERQLRKANR